MLIIVETTFLKDADEIISDLSFRLRNKIKKVRRTAREIRFINGDTIKFISLNSNRIDGLRADVAVGPNANAITCRSKQTKRIWDNAELNNYLKNL